MSDILSEMSDTQASPLTKDFKIDLPEDVSFIINTIEKNGHQAYAVGGCVRDTIMGVTPNDWDITTNALPEEVKSDRKSTRLNSSHDRQSRMPSSA